MAKYQHLIDQWQNMLNSGRIPIMEYEIKLNDEKEFLVVDISCDNHGLYFYFDDFDLPKHFSGNVKKWNDEFLIRFDDCFHNLDHYLQAINDEITEGFILPNNLLCEGSE